MKWFCRTGSLCSRITGGDFVLDGRTGELIKTVRDTTDFSIGQDKTAHWTVTRTRIADK